MRKPPKHINTEHRYLNFYLYSACLYFLVTATATAAFSSALPTRGSILNLVRNQRSKCACLQPNAPLARIPLLVQRLVLLFNESSHSSSFLVFNPHPGQQVLPPIKVPDTPNQRSRNGQPDTQRQDDEPCSRHCFVVHCCQACCRRPDP